ncbi:SRPBCC family protein [Winogradskyella psychrotolerans]|uniref:SRPBCC family protein n=1 Tax=Winogradskyella psychrotolerans TaxID=1344585 RepID=UPI001C078231|nr:SRPBCC family protein [Winogradskyella psychrotolerans]MBU2930100.1 SRPBCC family protein [Winogradskyella psychrotolerans]
MAIIEIKTIIQADIKTCFDLARNIDFHKDSLAHSNEKAVAGKTSGLIELGESVTWEATHFGVKQKLTSKITAFKSPHYFVDEMTSGAFKSFKHEHIFETRTDNQFYGNYTLMIDRFQFQSPLGILGKIANFMFLERYMRNLLKTRNEYLKLKAENLVHAVT